MKRIFNVTIVILVLFLTASVCSAVDLLDATKPSNKDTIASVTSYERETRTKVNEVIANIPDIANWEVVTGADSPASGDKLAVDTAAIPCTITLPASPATGAFVYLTDSKGSWGTNNVTLDRNGEKINGVAANYVLSSGGLTVTLVYTGSAYGWGVANAYVMVTADITTPTTTPALVSGAQLQTAALRAIQRTNVQTLSGNMVLLYNDAPMQVLDPNGSDRNVTLPDPALCTYQSFFIANTGSGVELLNIKDFGAAQLRAVRPGYEGTYYSDGIAWREVGSNANITRIGYPTNATQLVADVADSAIDTIELSGDVTLAAPLTIPAGKTYRAILGAVLTTTAVNTLTFASGSHLQDNGGQMFDAAVGEVVLAGGSTSNPVWFGMSESSSSTVNRAAVEAAWEALTSGGKFVVPAGDYTLESASGEISLDADNIRVEMQPGAIFRSEEDDKMFIVLTGKNIHWMGGQIIGTDVFYDNDSSSRPRALLAVDRDGATERANIVFENVTVSGINVAGFLCYRAVGVTYRNCRAYGQSGLSEYIEGVNNYNNFYGFYVHTSAYVTYDQVYVEQVGEGICGAGINSATYTFDSFDGVSSTGNLRHISVLNSDINRNYDHGIYLSSYCDFITVDNNRIRGCEHNGIKTEGYNNKITNNFSRNGIGYVGRNLVSALIEGNTFYVQDGTAGTYGIGIDVAGTTFERDTENIKIINNRVVEESVSGRWGIRVTGINIDADNQRLLKKIEIRGNEVYGFGYSTGASIYVLQEQAAVDTDQATDIIVADNIVEPTCASGTWRGIFLSSVDNFTVTGNIIKAFGTNGVFVYDADNGTIDNNIFVSGTTGIGTSTAGSGVAIGHGNRFDTVSVPVSDTIGMLIDDRRVVLSETLSGDKTLQFRNGYHIYAANGGIADRNVTPSDYWPLNHILTIYNTGATNALVFQPAGVNVTIAAGAKAVFICTAMASGGTWTQLE